MNVSIEPARVNGKLAERPAGAAAEVADEARLEEQRLRSEAAQRGATVLGTIVSVMMQAPAFAGRPVGDLKWLVVPAIATGQYSLAQARSKATGEIRTVGVLLWASVSDAVDARLSGSTDHVTRLDPEDWRSGDNVWVVEGIGERSVIAQQIRQLRQREWLGRPVKMKLRGQDGAPIVRQLPAG